MKKLLLLTCSIMVLGLALNAQIDPVLYYSFSDTSAAVAVDGSGNSNDGDILGTPKWVEGIKGNAFEIDDTQSVVIGNIGMFSTLGSVTMWLSCDTPNVKTNDIRCFWWAGNPTNADPTITGLGNGFGSQYEMHMHFESIDASYWAGGELSFWANGETGEADSSVHLFSDPDKGTSAGTPPVNPVIITDMEWHHVAATFGYDAAKLYIDGELIMEKVYYPGSGYTLTHMFLGKMGGDNRRYVGKIDEVRIYDDVISASDIADLITADTTPVSVQQSAINAFDIIASPNPASTMARISFNLKESAQTCATLYDMAGSKVAVMYNKFSVKGYNSFSYDVSALPSGVYFIRMESAGKTGFTKLVIR